MKPEDQPWEPLTPEDARELLAGLPIRWWVAGGWALELAEGRVTRQHRDLDIAVLRPEHEALRMHLADWDLQIAYRGELRPWTSGPVGPPENAVWARPTAADAWHLDVKIELVDGDDWVYRRDRSVRHPVESIGATTENGIPYLRREIVALYASG